MSPSQPVVGPPVARASLTSCQVRWALAIAACLAAYLVVLGPTTTGLGAQPDTAASAQEAEFLRLLNGERAEAGLLALTLHSSLSTVARSWSTTMASSGALEHNPNLRADIESRMGDVGRIAENVATGGNVLRLHQALVASPGHHRNLMGDYRLVGIGVAVTGATTWVTFNFVDALGATVPPALEPAPAPAPPSLVPDLATPPPSTTPTSTAPPITVPAAPAVPASPSGIDATSAAVAEAGMFSSPSLPSSSGSVPSSSEWSTESQSYMDAWDDGAGCSTAAWMLAFWPSMVADMTPEAQAALSRMAADGQCCGAAMPRAGLSCPGARPGDLE